MFQNWIRVPNLINGLVPNNKHALCFKPQARFFFDPRHPTPFVSTFFVLNLLGFLFTFQPHSFWPKLLFWVGEGSVRRKGMQSVQRHSSLVGVAFFRLLTMKPSYRYSLKLSSVATSEGKRAEKMERMRDLSLRHHSTHWSLGSTSKCDIWSK